MTHLLTMFTLTASVLYLGTNSEWQALSFDGVDSNEVSFSDPGMEIRVSNSASPVLYLFPEPQMVQSVSARGRIEGRLNLSPDVTWLSAPDDALLRVGIIETGDRRLSALQKLAAPNWIKKLETLVSSGDSGVGSIHCFHLLPRRDWLGKVRTNPNVSLFREEVVATPNEDGSFLLRGEVAPPVEAHGIWILADGDDTGSEFTVFIEKIEVMMETE